MPRITYEDFVIPSQLYEAGKEKLIQVEQTKEGRPFSCMLLGTSPTNHIVQFDVSNPSTNGNEKTLYLTVKNKYTQNLQTALRIQVYYIDLNTVHQ